MVNAIRILALSDLNWTSRGTNYESLVALIEQTQPALVLLAGDIVDSDKGKPDSKCPACWHEMGRVLDYLEARQTKCYIVRGNWDEKHVYDDLMKRPYQHIQEISNQLVDFRGIKIWGIPHNRTTRKIDMPAQTQPVDIILTHADGTRRMMLFEYQAKLIITGHYDEKLAVVRGRGFVSFSQFPNQYAVIDYAPDSIRIRYLYNDRFRIQSEPVFYELEIKQGRAVWDTEEAQQRFAPFTAQMEGLLSVKEREPSLSPEEKQAAIDQLLAVGVPKAQIVEHIPKASAFLPKKAARSKA